MGWFSFFGRMSQIFVSGAQSKKWYCLGFSGEPSSSSTDQVKKSSKWIIWGGMTGRGLTGIHSLPQGQTLTADYYINNTLEKEVKPVLHRKCEWSNRQGKIVQLQSPHDVRPRRGASTRSQGHPGMVQKKPAKFYRENMPAPKFPRYQPCGESLEHNGWSCL